MTEEKKQEQTFAIQRIYVKDLSFEAPNTPKTFVEEWKPEVKVELNITHEQLEEGVYEILLSVTVTATLGKSVAFLVEVKQAGIFTIAHFSEDQLKPMLNSFCPNILFPYAREVISDVITRGGFPQLLLAPVNFDALYAQRLEQEKKSADESTH